MIDCFVSYCGKDASELNVKLLVCELKARVGEQVQFHAYYEQDFGSSLTRFMGETLQEAKAILFLFGPEYRRRVDEQDTASGAYQEFDNYVVRIRQSDELYPPVAIPVWWSGPSVEDCKPQYFELENPKFCDLHTFRCHGTTENTAFLSESVLKKFGPVLDRIAKQLTRLDDSFGTETTEEKRLVLETFVNPAAIPAQISHIPTIEDVLESKFEYGEYDTQHFLDNYFTSTRFFRRLRDRNVGLISGRKGSGKTTLVQIRELEAKNADFFPVIDIAVERWNIHYLIQNTSFKQSEGDFEYVDIEARFFDFVWCAYVGLSMCVSIYFQNRKDEFFEIGKSGNTNAELKKLVAKAITIDHVDYAALFDISVGAVREYVQDVVDHADPTSEERFRLDVLGRVRIDAFVETLFGPRMQYLKDAMALGNGRRFLFCFDRFDTELQRYRKEQEHLPADQRERAERREINWLASLTLFVDKTLRPDRTAPDAWVFRFFSIVKFIVVLPHDRLLELRESHRDAIAGEKVEEIRWQAAELMTMLRKRIQVLRGVSDEQLNRASNKSPRERFACCMKEARQGLPNKVSIIVGNKSYEMDIFLYVLRHSFFRPRDVLIYYASVLGYCQAMEKRGRTPAVDVIKQIVAGDTRTIVRLEFIGELRDTWKNVQEVMHLFTGCRQLLDFRSLEAVIGPPVFDIVGHAGGLRSMSEKVMFLYELGFLGFRSPRRGAHSARDQEFQFSFIDDALSPPLDSLDVLKTLEFAIHPIFVETLFLEVNVTKPVLYLEWEWMDRIDRLD